SLYPVDPILLQSRLCENVLPSFTQGDNPFSDLLYTGFILAGIEKIHLALADHIVNDLDFLIYISADNRLDILLQNRNDVIPVCRDNTLFSFPFPFWITLGD
ncbi:MAG: hypothetical protein K6B52_06870, partial [Clostridiales bacterium]|nr:hypothetical protein [Clostridiales bacterium]